jgi:GT2 family glycosyltransferase
MLTIAIPIMDQLSDAIGILKLLRDNTSRATEFLIIDNGSTDPVEDVFRNYIKPSKLNYIRNEQNIGLVKTMQQAYENCQTEYLAIMHDDVFIYEKDWDVTVLQLIKSMGNIGVAGFFGVQGIGKVGERIQDVDKSGQAPGMSNMLEAEKHGMRLKTDWHPCATVDGFTMIIDMELLRKTGGFDQRYKYHHYYDRDICLESLRHGYNNIVIGVSCHHLSGLTANRGQYQTWIDSQTAQSREGDEKGRTGDKWTHDTNAELFFNKWKEVTPLYVLEDFSFRDNSIKYTFGEYQKDKIRGYKL